MDRDCNGSVTNIEIVNFLRDNGVSHVSDSEAYNLVIFFDNNGNTRLSYDEWVQMYLPCEDNYLRDRTMARFAPSILRSEGLPRDIELAMCDVIEKEIALQRNLESLKVDLAGCYEFTSTAAFVSVDVYRSGVLTTVNVSDFLRSQGAYLSELELVAIIRRIDTDGNCSVTMRELDEFMRPLSGVKPTYASPARTASTKYSSPVRVRTTASLLDSPVALSRSFSVERRVPLVSSVSPYAYPTYFDLDYPAYKYRYLDYPYPYYRPSLYAPSLYGPYLPYSPYSRYNPLYRSPYDRTYYSPALGRYVAV
jgi:Ca2+-binding EF-hand superfamily protein